MSPTMLMAISSFIKFAQSSRNSINIARLALNTTHISHLVILSHAKRLLVAADQSETKKENQKTLPYHPHHRLHPLLPKCKPYCCLLLVLSFWQCYTPSSSFKHDASIKHFLSSHFTLVFQSIFSPVSIGK
jgi:hypothetical protein